MTKKQLRQEKAESKGKIVIGEAYKSAVDLNKQKLPKGWRAETNAVPLPFSRPWSECKWSEGVNTVGDLGHTIEQVGLAYLFGHLETICSEQAGLYGDGCLDVFPQNEVLAGAWAYFAKRFGDMEKFLSAYQMKPIAEAEKGRS